jgi:hypothetical protein
MLEGRLQHLESGFKSLEDRQISQGKTLDGLGIKLDQVIHAVTLQSAKPAFDLAKILTVAATLIVIFGATASGIIYVAGNVSAPGILSNKMQVEFLRERLDNGWVKTSNVTVRTKNDTGS